MACKEDIEKRTHPAFENKNEHSKMRGQTKFNRFMRPNHIIDIFNTDELTENKKKHFVLVFSGKMKLYCSTFLYLVFGGVL